VKLKAAEAIERLAAEVDGDPHGAFSGGTAGGSVEEPQKK